MNFIIVDLRTVLKWKNCCLNCCKDNEHGIQMECALVDSDVM